MPFQQPPPAVLDLPGGLALRELSPADAPTIFATVEANRDHLRAWLPWVDSARQESDTLAFLQELAHKRAGGLTLAWGLYLDALFRGIIGLHDISLSNSKLQVGYWIARDCEGQGLMTRASQALLQVAFDTLRMERVEIRCARLNHRSCAIPERLGFTLEGVLRHSQRLRGDFLDLNIYSLLEREYRERFSTA